MALIFKNDVGKRFLFFTNYKVMYSALRKMLTLNFPGILVYTNHQNIQDLDDYFKISIVRNPFDRLLSLFFDKCRFNPGDLRNKKQNIYLQVNQVQILKAFSALYDKHVNIVEPLTKHEDNTESFENILENMTVLESITFNEFVQITSYVSKLNNVDAHFIPQSKIMTRNGKLIIDKVFKIENINENWGQICDMLNKEIPLIYGANRTNFEGPDKYQRFYDMDMKKLVFDLYQQDFENFGYQY